MAKLTHTHVSEEDVICSACVVCEKDKCVHRLPHPSTEGCRSTCIYHILEECVPLKDSGYYDEVKC